MRTAAHFTFALPGPLSVPLSLGDRTIAAGTAVLPVIHAAHKDPGHDPGLYSLRRGPAGSLAWGAGMHACLGREVALMILEEATAALAGAGPELTEAPREWTAGTMPEPRTLLAAT